MLASAGTRRRTRLATRCTHDVALRYAFSLLGRYACRVSLEVNNLLNQQYEVIQNYPMPGTNVRLGWEMTW